MSPEPLAGYILDRGPHRF